jgi:hypothetical protein
MFAEVAARVPAFAGTYVDEAGSRLVVLATHVDEFVAAAAKAALIDVLQDQSLSALQPVATKVLYPFAQLKRWHDRVTTDLLAIPGVVLTDIDDVRNRVRVGVTGLASLRSLVEVRLSMLGVPLDAVFVEEAAPFLSLSSLRDKHRPVVGGLQIGSATKICTLGFNATRGSVTGFVTNSHCTNTPGGSEGTQFGQPSTSLLNKIGVESVDPFYFTGGACPAGRRCRYSDTSFVTYNSGASFTRGMVAAAPLNSYAWNGTDKFRVTAETSPLIGQSVAKVGRTTGKTIGTVTHQCVNIQVLGTNITLLCQSQAGGSSDSGDSGSPVIRSETSGAPTDVSLKGILWGGDGSSFAFSSVGQIIRSDELGQLTTCATGFSC